MLFSYSTVFVTCLSCTVMLYPHIINSTWWVKRSPPGLKIKCSWHRSVVTRKLDTSQCITDLGSISSPSHFGCRSKGCCSCKWFLKSLRLNLSSFVSLSYRELYLNCQRYTITTVCILHITFSPWAISSDPNYQSHLIRVLLLLWTWFQPSDKWVKSVSWNNWSVSAI